ncbi:amidohydrolase [Paenibacillus shirakamiensis]|uniref:Amidohydrolase n=1 Tax=Paenibacillus shirakamiensis TaxID=1265935 RepID=A0ABS4JIN4_9BACL|nr:amidohydrolase [Paenibacillus shirakamiensis]MBP2001553.1 amidohydrolase [Paenibacillus shirakamiensis]
MTTHSILSPKAYALTDQLIAIRRQLHQHPEVSHEEIQTTASIRGWLGQANIRILDVPLATGVIAEVGGQRGGPIIALRADIDALPIHEETEFEFSSQIAGTMHACGHDYHTASLLGAAFLLKEQEEELQGTVRFIFQPAEEKAEGAELVIQSGALEGVQAIFGLHNKPDLPVGTIGIRSGPLMAGADGFVIEVEGTGTHAAVPQSGNDPIVAASHIITALQSIVSRNVNSLQSAVVSVTRFHSGTAWNIIPDKAVLDGTIRTFEETVREKVLARFEEIVQGVSSAFGTQAELRWLQGPPPVHNDALLEPLVREAAQLAGLTVVLPDPTSAGEDFAFYQKQIPGFFVFMGTSGSHEWHHPSFDLNEDALAPSASYFAALAELALNSFSDNISD